jgi:hypothetical protein
MKVQTIKADEAERFRHIQRDVRMGYGVTLKDLALLVRLVEKLDKAEVLKVAKPKTVNFFFVAVDDATMPDGKKFGVECEACGDRFFDRLSKGKKGQGQRVLESGVPQAIAHAKAMHQSTGGTVGPRRKVN